MTKPVSNRPWIALLLLLLAPAAVAQPPETFRSLDQQVETLKQEVIDINRELFMLEEELLFPANTQTFFFLSSEGDGLFQLDSVQLSVDGEVVSNYLYTQREVDALARGGVQKLHVQNLKQGTHEVVAIFIGKGPQGRDYRRGAQLNFEKDFDPKYIELKIIESAQKRQPEFQIKEW